MRKARVKRTGTQKQSANGPVLLTVDEVAKAVEMDPQLLRNYVAAGGIIEPVVRGSKGRAKPHLFSCQQGMGLAWAMACVDAGIFKVRGQVRQLVEAALKDPWDEWERWLRSPDSPWDEEEQAVRALRRGRECPSWFPEEVLLDICRRSLSARGHRPQARTATGIRCIEPGPSTQTDSNRARMIRGTGPLGMVALLSP
jgi:hypothetical protein